MTDIIKSYYSTFLKSEYSSNNPELTITLTLINLQRLRGLAYLIILIMVSMIFFDMAALGAIHKANALVMRPRFICMRLLFILISSIYLILLELPEQLEDISTKQKIFGDMYILINLVLIAVLTAFVQNIRDDISPYLMAIFFAASCIYMDRRQCTLFLGTALITMGIGTWMVQPDKGVFMYNMINASIMTIVAWISSQVIYSNRAKDFFNQQLIEKQSAQLAKSNEMLEYLSYHDALTDLPNRRYFEKYLQDEWSKAKNSGAPISLILADIDNFKELNDNYGHQVGDKCLNLVGLALCAVLDKPDAVVARLGGDEYGVIIPDADTKTARDTADKMLQAVRSSNNTKIINRQISISLGVASCLPSEEDSLTFFFAQADEALYTAKKMGRNQVAV